MNASQERGTDLGFRFRWCVFRPNARTILWQCYYLPPGRHKKQKLAGVNGYRLYCTQTWTCEKKNVANSRSTLAQSNLTLHQSAHFASRSHEPEAQKPLQITKFDKLCTMKSKTKAGHKSVKSPILYHTAETRKANATTLLANATNHTGLPLLRHIIFTPACKLSITLHVGTVEASLRIREQKTKQVGELQRHPKQRADHNTNTTKSVPPSSTTPKDWV